MPRPRNNSKPRTFRLTLLLCNRTDRKVPSLLLRTLLVVATNRLRLNSSSSMASHPNTNNLNTGSRSNSSNNQAATRDLRLPRRRHHMGSRLRIARHLTALRRTAHRHTIRALDFLRKATAAMFVFTCAALLARIWYE